MTTSTCAFYYAKPAPDFGGMAPETPPGIIWGQGTPGAIEPFTIVNKGSLYLQTDNTDDYQCVYMKVDEGGDAGDWASLLLGGASDTTAANVIAQTYSSAELHGVDITYTGTQASGGSLVALNVAHTVAGSSGMWSSAIFAKMTQSATESVTGYMSGAELEINSSVTQANTPCQMWPLVLNSNCISVGTNSAFIALRDYATTATMGAVLSLFDVTDATTVSTTKVFSGLSAGKETTIDCAIRCMYKDNPFWLLGSKTAPA